MEVVHTPVLLNECLNLLSPEWETYESSPLMVDATMGEGGHSINFLKTFPSLKIIGLDADKNIQERAKLRLEDYSSRVKFYNVWSKDFFENYPTDLERPDIILFDLGISVFHYEKSGRGFSFRKDEPLDMRLSESGESASDLVNNLRQEELASLIFKYGEEKFSRRIAEAIVSSRTWGRIESSSALAELIWSAVPASYRYGPLHPATRTFQALRIAVNGEIENLPFMIHNAFKSLNVGGKLGVITFHSLEDRIVKNYFRNLGKKCVCPPEVAVCRCGGVQCAKVITKKPIIPSDEEIRNNSPSRSAKFRVVKKLSEPSEFHLSGIGGEKE